MRKTVKNISDEILSIPNVGKVSPGETIEVPEDFNNPNFEVVKGKKKDAEKDTKADFKSNKDN